ncbi:MAG: DUF502 domain-containing protein [Candidatus Melainabacteria bacterium]|nr:DUF502 domain-containing protein [Candidatus Melainabacteria bacterium]
MAIQQQTKELILKCLKRGLILSVPGIFTIWLLSIVFGVADKVVGPITRTLIDLIVPAWLQVGPLTNGESPVLSFLLLLLILTVLGGFVSWRWGERIVRWFENQIIKVPGIGFIYRNTRKMSAFFDLEKGSPFERVVLIPYPHAEILTKAFVSGKMTLVYADGTEEVVLKVVVPNPPTGVQGICLVPERLCIPIDLTVEEGLQFYVSLSVVAPEKLKLPINRCDLWPNCVGQEAAR